MPDRRRFLSAVCLAAPFASACQNILGPRRIDDDWDVQERGRFTFYARPSSFGARSVDQLYTVLDDQYNATTAMLDVRYGGHISIFLYNSGIDAGLPSDGSGVAYPDTQAVRAACVAPVDANLMFLLSHECNHVIARNTIGQAGTTFMNEGIATALVTERFHSRGRHFLYPWTASRAGQLPSLSSLLDDGHWHDAPEDVAYNASASFIAWLIDTRGPMPVKDVFGAPSRDIESRLQTAYGQPVARLESDWIAFCSGWRG